MQTLVNTATIQWIHSTTKYHKAKVTTTKNRRYMYILFQKYPNWESRANVCPICPATQKKPTLSSTLFHNNEVNTCTRMYRYYYLQKYPNRESKKNAHHIRRPPRKPRISPSLQFGWTITKLYTYQFTSRLTQHKPYS